jgi:hypothetical protein
VKKNIEKEKRNRRNAIDRRSYSYARHIPERRNGGDRRNDEEGCPILADLETPEGSGENQGIEESNHKS